MLNWKSIYDRNFKILDLIDNVKIVESLQKLQIESQKITYKKNL